MTAAFYDDPAFLYGNTSRLYDEVPATFDANRLQWRFEVAWLSDFVYFSETNGQTEAIYAYDCYWSRGRPTFVNYDGNGLTLQQPGRMVITLVNPSKRYDPNNTSSPLYPNVIPGKLARLGVRKISSSTYTWRFSGTVEDVRVSRTPDGQEIAEITIVDGWKWLQDRTIYLAAQRDLPSSSNILEVLFRAVWPDLWGSSLSDDANDLPYFWSAGRDARTLLHDMAETQGSRVWITGNGKLNYEPATPVGAATVTFSQSDLLKEISVNNPWQNKWNVGTFEYQVPYNIPNPLMLQVWGGTVGGNSLYEHTIDTGQTLVIDGNYALPSTVPAVYSGTDLSQWDFLVLITRSFPVTGELFVPYPSMTWRSATGGGGVDVSGYVEILSFEDGGDGFRLTLKNNYTGTVYLSEMKIGAWTQMAIKGLQTIAHDLAGNETKKTVSFESPYMILAGGLTSAATKTLAANQMDWIRATSLYPEITLEGKPDKQFFDVFGMFLLSVTYMGISLTMRCGTIKETWESNNAQSVRTILVGEPAEF